jgi:hypothetical protein
MVETATPTQLKPETLQSFATYVREAEAALDKTLHGSGPFLWSEGNADTAQQVREGKVVAQFWSGNGPVKVPSGLVHDWVGATFIPDATVERLLALIQDYDNHKNIYRPEVIASKLISHSGNDFQI